MDTLVFTTKARDYIQNYSNEITKIRTGKANTSILKDVRVMSFGDLQPLSHVASISNQDAFTIIIRPFDRGSIKPIIESLTKANLGVNPQEDGDKIRIVFAALTGDKRKELVKELKAKTEQAKINIRQVRRDWQAKIKASKDFSENEKIIHEENMEKEINKFLSELENLQAEKEKAILAI
ncbi:hypothetical protein ASO20_02685 [Mycoplasma sp. (ex Biomphalaria glabrata)]|uniref:ribosome recycling factor n=1 Tax=Mycoplasma sp. (ex Biomphalaria glabrata) TaxID=1749074 RepID=UPI00073A7897|nr:ribosome recycling factor [Mycoplasma sp. (ex Biomphalaria glabrata)]ALV23541.1 hypothetical protein ASO20_02685 [Mycoplasma sp. (ex Biomphalaria glabrata)]